MDWIWIGWGFLVVAAAVAVFLIRALNQVSRTVRNLGTLVNSLETEITPLVRNLRETSENINGLLVQTQERLNQLEGLFLTLKESAQIFSMINRIFRGGVTPTLVNMAGLAVGIKTAGQSFFKRKGKGGK
ncbi:MAG: DUF948 domain-containing protein [Deltaproteobacteria bacterium]|nr:DUF948 domain-containing protein [Deltaproteobacteria bacterium]